MLGSSLEQPGVDGHGETLGLHLHDHLGLLVEEDLGEVTVEAKPRHRMSCGVPAIPRIIVRQATLTFSQSR